MSDNMDTLLERLSVLGLSNEEAKIYIELLKEPKTHLRLSHLTGINRTKVYRLVEQLEKQSLVTKLTDDRGTFLTAADPSNLGVQLIAKEEEVRHQRRVMDELLPSLSALQASGRSAFVVRTYEGYEGLRQMVWHELKTKGELLIFGSGTVEELVPNRHWAEKHRALTTMAGYKVRELMNQRAEDHPVDFTEHPKFMNIYSYRRIPRSILELNNQVSIYNDTVAIYHWREGQKVGVEVVNRSYAQMMRQMFEEYWQMALPD